MLHEKRVTDGNFLVVKHHSLVFESKEPKDGYDAVEVKNPKTGEFITKYIKRFEAVDGMIKRIEWYDSKDAYATRYMGIKIHITDKGQYFQLDLPYNSRPYDSFTKLAENIDYEKPVEFSVWHDKKQDSTAFAVRQDGVPVKWKYTRDNMGECPQAEQDELGKWDFKAQRLWLRSQMLNVVIPHVEALNQFDEPEPEYSGVDEDAIEERKAIQSIAPEDDPDNPLNAPPDITQEPPSVSSDPDSETIIPF